jgi:hypothetical protein
MRKIKRAAADRFVILAQVDKRRFNNDRFLGWRFYLLQRSQNH